MAREIKLKLSPEKVAARGLALASGYVASCDIDAARRLYASEMPVEVNLAFQEMAEAAAVFKVKAIAAQQMARAHVEKVREGNGQG